MDKVEKKFSRLGEQLESAFNGILAEKVGPEQEAAKRLREGVEKRLGDKELLALAKQAASVEPSPVDTEQVEAARNKMHEGVEFLALGFTYIAEAMEDGKLTEEEKKERWREISAFLMAPKSVEKSQPEIGQMELTEKGPWLMAKDAGREAGLDQNRTRSVIKMLSDEKLILEGDTRPAGRETAVSPYVQYALVQASRVTAEHEAGGGSYLKAAKLAERVRSRMPDRELVGLVSQLDTDGEELSMCYRLLGKWPKLDNETRQAVEARKNELNNKDSKINVIEPVRKDVEKRRRMMQELARLVCAEPRPNLGDMVERRIAWAELNKLAKESCIKNDGKIEIFLDGMLDNSEIRAAESGEGGVVDSTKRIRPIS
jgi:hypothetical protein